MMDEGKQSLVGTMWQQKIWVYPLLIVAGIGLGAFKMAENQKAADFARNGVKAVGEVTHLHENITKRPKTHSVSYSFATDADPYTHGQQRVSEPLFDTLTANGPIDVWYLPTDPGQSAVDLGYLVRYFWLAMLCAAGLILTGLVGGWFAITRARATLRAKGKDS